MGTIGTARTRSLEGVWLGEASFDGDRPSGPAVVCVWTLARGPAVNNK